MPQPSERSGDAGAPPTRWLVDGLNVIGTRPDGWWRDRRGAMRSLAAKLERFAVETGEAVSVVFDGRPFAIDGPERTVTVHFAPGPGPGAADDELVRLISASGDPAAICLVTSDGQLAARGRELGASVTGASGFRRRLDGLDDA